MSRDYREHYDNDDGYGSGYGSSSYGSSSSHGPLPSTTSDVRQLMQQNQRALSNISITTDENGEATFLGMTVPRSMKHGLEIGLASVRPYLINWTDEIFHHAGRMARKMGGSAKAAYTAGLVAENLWRWGVLVGGKTGVDFIQASTGYAKKRNNLFKDFAQVMEATGANPGNNEVLRVAFSEIQDDWITDVKMMLSDLPTLIPMVLLAAQDHTAARNHRKGVAPEKFFPEKGARKADSNISQQKIDQDREARDNARKKAADEAREHQEFLRKELEAAEQGYVSRNKDKQFSADEVSDIIDGAEAGKKYTLTEDQLRRKYREEEQANDRETLRQHINSQRRGEHDDHHGQRRDTEEAKTDNTLKLLAPFAAVASEFLKSGFSDEAAKRKKRIKAYKMIEHLRHEMETQCGKVNGSGYDGCDRSFTSKPADDIRITGMGDKEGQDLSLKDFIVDIFQQHERDRDPSRTFRDAKGKVIDPLKGTLLTNLQPAAELLAQHLADGSLSADALYKAVGENRIIKHSKKGAKTFANEKEAADYIEKELVPVLSTREIIKMDEFMAKFSDPALIKDTLKKNLEGMKGKERVLFASLFPDDILQQAGIRQKEINKIRTESHQYAYDFIAANVMHLAAKDPEKLKELGASEKEINAIKDLAEKIEAGDVKAVKVAVDGRDKEAVDAVRTVGLLEQTKGKEDGYWATRIKEMGGAHEKLREKKQNRERENENKNGPDQMYLGKKSEKSRLDYSRDYGPSQRDEKDKEDSWAPEKPDPSYSKRFDPSDAGKSTKKGSHDLRPYT